MHLSRNFLAVLLPPSSLYKVETRKKFWIHASNIVWGVKGRVGPVRIGKRSRNASVSRLLSKIVDMTTKLSEFSYTLSGSILFSTWRARQYWCYHSNRVLTAMIFKILLFFYKKIYFYSCILNYCVRLNLAIFYQIYCNCYLRVLKLSSSEWSVKTDRKSVV